MRKADEHEQETFGELGTRTALILNGPPDSGKDTLAELLTAKGYQHDRFKAGLYRATAEYFVVPLVEVTQLCTDRLHKEDENLAFPMAKYKNAYYSPREALIHVSEDIMKPEFGQDVFGQAVAKKHRGGTGDVVFSDGGFPAEILPLLDVFDTINICRLHREGRDFSGDSRGYLFASQELQHPDIKFFDVDIIEDNPEITSTVILLQTYLSGI